MNSAILVISAACFSILSAVVSGMVLNVVSSLDARLSRVESIMMERKPK